MFTFLIVCLILIVQLFICREIFKALSWLLSQAAAYARGISKEHQQRIGYADGWNEGVNLGRKAGVMEGFNDGKAQGIMIGQEHGFKVGKEQGYEAGKKKFYDDLAKPFVDMAKAIQEGIAQHQNSRPSRRTVPGIRI